MPTWGKPVKGPSRLRRGLGFLRALRSPVSMGQWAIRQVSGVMGAAAIIPFIGILLMVLRPIIALEVQKKVQEELEKKRLEEERKRAELYEQEIYRGLVPE
jgi:hypothetical protein